MFRARGQPGDTASRDLLAVFYHNFAICARRSCAGPKHLTGMHAAVTTQAMRRQRCVCSGSCSGKDDLVPAESPKSPSGPQRPQVCRSDESQPGRYSVLATKRDPILLPPIDVLENDLIRALQPAWAAFLRLRKVKPVALYRVRALLAPNLIIAVRIQGERRAVAKAAASVYVEASAVVCAGNLRLSIERRRE